LKGLFLEGSKAGNIKRPDIGGKKSHAAKARIKLRSRSWAAWSTAKVHSRNPGRIASYKDPHATSDSGGACGDKLLNGLFKNQWQNGLQLHLRFALIHHKTPSLASRLSFFRERVRNGGWYGPEKLAS